MNTTSQVILEFTFSMLIIFLLIYATIRIFQWTGLGLAERRIAHENQLIAFVDENYNGINNQKPPTPLTQVDPYFYNQRRIKAVWGER